nr:MAG TPA: hypothetical protein [Caudoviricetes sp.]
MFLLLLEFAKKTWTVMKREDMLYHFLFYF